MGDIFRLFLWNISSPFPLWIVFPTRCQTHAPFGAKPVWMLLSNSTAPIEFSSAFLANKRPHLPPFFFAHLAFAAATAISFRRFFESVAALALPPAD
jgi:hypothetical protein